CGEEASGGMACDCSSDQWSAGLEADRFGAELRREVDAVEGVIDALLTPGGIGLDPGGMVRVAAREEGEGVDVADRKSAALEPVERLASAAVVHRGGVGVVQVGHQLHACVTDLTDRVDRLVEGVLL